MLWNCLIEYFQAHQQISTYGTTRIDNKNLDNFFTFKIKDNPSYINDLHNIFTKMKYDYVINCLAYNKIFTNNLEDCHKALIINAHLPKTLQILSKKYQYKLIHISTNWVFMWNAGHYTVEDIPDELWFYGCSKYLWEISSYPHITFRTSIIGVEKETSKNLLSWFLKSSEPQVQGLNSVFWNWVTTLTLAKIIEEIILNDLPISWVIQISGEIISKYDLLLLFKDIFQKKIEVIPSDISKLNQTITPSKEQKKYFTHLILPIKDQVQELKQFYHL